MPATYVGPIGAQVVILWGYHVQEVMWTRQGGKGEGQRGGQNGDGEGM